MFKSQKKYIIFCLIAVFLMITANLALAQTSSTTTSTSTTNEQTQLQQQLNVIESQIAQDEQQLTQIKGQKNTLTNKINQLKKQQASLTLQVQATSLEISVVNDQMTATQADINTNTAKINTLKSQLANLLAETNVTDGYSLLYILLSQNSLSDVLDQIESYSEISQNIKSLTDQTVQLNQQLATKQQALTQQQNDDNNLLSIQSLQQQQLAGSVSAQNTLLAQTKGKESNYQAQLTDTQNQAAQIRNQLYQLLGVSSSVTFGQALQIAQLASSETGVRAAFLLAILTQESNLGKNVGTCNRPGDPPSKSYKVVMKPDRDIQPFLQITADLGMDPNVTPVSCPLHDSQGNQEGWGGAMGPAQFIPSTWVGYEAQVVAITGKAANPWDISDAFLAAAIKLKAGGAGTQAGEWAAAMRYFSGGTNPKYSFYGDSVVATAAMYQTDIDNLNK